MEFNKLIWIQVPTLTTGYEQVAQALTTIINCEHLTIISENQSSIATSFQVTLYNFHIPSTKSYLSVLGDYKIIINYKRNGQFFMPSVFTPVYRIL